MRLSLPGTLGLEQSNKTAHFAKLALLNVLLEPPIPV